MRDKEWFRRICPQLEEFWNDVNYFRKNGGVKSIISIRKRKLDDISNEEDNDYVSSTHYPNIDKKYPVEPPAKCTRSQYYAYNTNKKYNVQRHKQ